MMKSIGLMFALVTPVLPLSVAAMPQTATEQQQDPRVLQAQQALEQLEHQQGTKFSYLRQSEMGERTMLEQFLPLKAEGEQWQLLQENGETPSANRLQEYRQMKQDEAKASAEQKEEEQGVKLSLSKLVQKDTLAYVDTIQRQQQRVHQFSFVPHLDKFSEHNEKLKGQLYVVADDSQLDAIEIQLKEEFSPATSVTLEAFQLTIDLMPLTADNGKRYIVPAQTEERVAGSYLFFKDFDDHTVRHYRDYQVMETPASASASANSDNAAKP